MMQAAILLQLAVCCPLVLVGAESPMTVRTAERASSVLPIAGQNISAATAMASTTVERTVAKVAIPLASAQPEAKQSNLDAEVKRRRVAESEVSRLSDVVAEERVLLKAEQNQEIAGQKSSKAVLAGKVRALNDALASLQQADNQRKASKRATWEEESALARAKDALAVETSEKEDASNLAAKLRLELQKARADTESLKQNDLAAKLRFELQKAHADTEVLKQKLGRVVQMVQTDLAVKDKQAANAMAAEQRISKKLQVRLAAQKLQLRLRGARFSPV